MPLGLVFRKAVLWHRGAQYNFTGLKGAVTKSPEGLKWTFISAARDGSQLHGEISGAGAHTHRLPYLKTDCSGSFEVTNNSLASAAIRLDIPGGVVETLSTSSGAVLEVAGL
jgi:hypothetical protein